MPPARSLASAIYREGRAILPRMATATTPHDTPRHRIFSSGKRRCKRLHRYN